MLINTARSDANYLVKDTGAYFTGTAFGKTKLFERISRKNLGKEVLEHLICSGIFLLINNLFWTIILI